MANKVQPCPLLMPAWLPKDRANSSSSAAARCRHRRNDKVVVIMGKSLLSAATRFHEQLGVADPVHGELTPRKVL